MNLREQITYIMQEHLIIKMKNIGREQIPTDYL